MTVAVSLRQVRKVFGSTEVIHGVNLDIAPGEFVVLVGPSGCGKSTLLRMIAGLEDVSAGEIRIDGATVNDIDPADRDIAMVFQSYALYPHMTVRDNLAFGLNARGFDAVTKANKIAATAAILGLEPLLTAIREIYLVASSSVLPWDAPWSAIREFFSSTNRYRISMPSCAPRCGSRLRRCTSD